MEQTKITIQDVMKYPNARVMYSGCTATITDIDLKRNKIYVTYEDGDCVWEFISDCQLSLNPIDKITPEHLKLVADEAHYMACIAEYSNEYFLFNSEYGTSFVKLEDLNYKMVDILRGLNYDIDGLIKSGKAVKI